LRIKAQDADGIPIVPGTIDSEDRCRSHHGLCFIIVFTLGWHKDFEEVGQAIGNLSMFCTLVMRVCR
ncbi:MAG: hypothetical protein Q9180_005488, partial [Flavoplaca navasiana]